MFVQDGAAAYGMVAFAEGGGYSGPVWNDTIPAGRSTVRVVASGPVTIRFSADGLRGRQVVRLRTPLRDSTGVVREGRSDGWGLSDEISFSARTSFVVHRLVTRGSNHARVTTFCLSGDSTNSSCGAEPQGVVLGPHTGELVEMNPAWADHGHGRFESVHTADPTYAMTHALVEIPLT